LVGIEFNCGIVVSEKEADATGIELRDFDGFFDEGIAVVGRRNGNFGERTAPKKTKHGGEGVCKVRKKWMWSFFQMGAHKTFRTKVTLAKKIKQNRPMPSW
jgi:hypothetical protein